MNRTFMHEQSSFPTEPLERAKWFTDQINKKILSPTIRKQHGWLTDTHILTSDEDERAIVVEIGVKGEKATLPEMNALETIFCKAARAFAGTQIYFGASDYIHGPDAIKKYGYAVLDVKWKDGKAFLMATYRFTG